MNIKQTLERSGKTLDSIAKSTEISVQRLREALESNSWNMVEVSRLAKLLNLAVEDLLSESTCQNYFGFQFRTPTMPFGPATTLPDYEIAKLNRYVHSALEVLEPQPESVWPLSGEICTLSPDLLATKFREMFFSDNLIGPILDLPTRCSDIFGCVLYTISSGNIDGASAFIQGRPFVFISRRFQGRMLFTLAHELGHLCKRGDNAADVFFIDEDIFAMGNAEEQFANKFASAVLMPEEGVLATIREFRTMADIKGPLGDIEIIILSHMFGVSFEAAGLRCETLGLLQAGGTDALNHYLKKNHTSAEKRAIELGLPERLDIEFPAVPSRLLDSALNRVRAGDMSLGDAVSVLGIGARDMFAVSSKGN